MMQLPDYSIAAVTVPVGEELRSQVAAFWIGNGAVPDAAEARRRADELVCVARNGAGEIVGLNTAYVSRLRADGERYYFYRMFVRPQDRHLKLSRALVAAAVPALRERRENDPAIHGVLLVTENRKLMRAGGRRLLVNLGWQPMGTDPRGLDIWSVDFD